jgi:hypothetical protein
MCGVTGFLTTGTRTIGAKDRAMYLRQTLVVDSLRGFHSTGVFHQRKDALGCGWAKQCGNGIDFVNSKNYAEIENMTPELRFAVGHNRWATTGDPDDVANAHPFTEGPITLVHNGTLDGDGGLKTSQITLGVAVDSHAICHNLAIHDAKEVLEDLDGAFTLIWHDTRDDTLNFCRNSDRPLTMWGESSTYNDTLYFGSERKMMEWIMSRNHIPAVSGKFFDLPAGELWKYKPDTLTPEVTKLDLYDAYSNWGNRYNYGQTGGNYKNGGKKYQNSTKTTQGSGGTGKITSIKSTKHGVSGAVNELLNEEGYDRSDRLPFLPTAAIGGIVVGVIEHLDQPCFITGITKLAAKQNFDTRWTIRPTGIRRMPDMSKDGAEVTVVMAHLCSWHYHESMWEYGAAFEKAVTESEVNGNVSPDPKQIEDMREPVTPEDYVIGGEKSSILMFPVGQDRYGTRALWFAKTANGCTMCHQLPASKEAEEVVWLEDGNDSFLCPACKESNHITS